MVLPLVSLIIRLLLFLNPLLEQLDVIMKHPLCFIFVNFDTSLQSSLPPQQSVPVYDIDLSMNRTGATLSCLILANSTYYCWQLASLITLSGSLDQYVTGKWTSSADHHKRCKKGVAGDILYSVIFECVFYLLS